jgi:hypothetical protein
MIFGGVFVATKKARRVYVQSPFFFKSDKLHCLPAALPMSKTSIIINIW